MAMHIQAPYDLTVRNYWVAHAHDLCSEVCTRDPLYCARMLPLKGARTRGNAILIGGRFLLRAISKRALQVAEVSFVSPQAGWALASCTEVTKGLTQSCRDTSGLLNQVDQASRVEYLRRGRLGIGMLSSTLAFFDHVRNTSLSWARGATWMRRRHSQGLEGGDEPRWVRPKPAATLKVSKSRHLHLLAPASGKDSLPILLDLFSVVQDSLDRAGRLSRALAYRLSSKKAD
jgi:hypothetical protein